MATKAYTSADIKQLPFPLNVQQRPGMYIGPNDSNGMLVCLREILNNSVDEHLAGYCDTIMVEILNDISFSVLDNGRGIPCDQHSSGKNTLEVIFGELHAGRNFEDKTVYSTGINGVGGSCVNALSETFIVSTYRGTKDKATITFKNGKLKDLGDNNKRISSLKTYTKVVSHLNPKFFETDSKLVSNDVERLVKETAYLNRGLKIIYKDTEGKVTKYHYTNGVEEFLKDEVGKKALFPVVSFPKASVKDNEIEVAFTYTNTFKGESITSFCNTINTSDGGMHVTGFKRALSAKILAYIKDNGLSKEKIENEDIFEGLNAIVSVFVFNPKYTSQTKTKLANTEVNGNVYSYANSAITEWLESKPESLKALVKKIELSAKARIAQKRAIENVKKDSSNSFTALSNIAKFSDCEEQMSGRTELYLVEGNSAGGTVTEGRDKRYQAVYRLRGKVLNTFGMDSNKIRNNKEIDDLISILKCGMGKNFDISKTKFDKIIICADADSDGFHIELLTATLFLEHFLDLVLDGRIYISVSPLYKVSITGKPPVYLNTSLDLAAFTNDQLSENYEIKGISKTSNKVKIVDKYLEYQSKINTFSDTYNLEKAIIERALLVNFDGKSLKLGKDIINLDKPFMYNSFYDDSEKGDDYFISLSVSNVEDFKERLEELKKLYSFVSKYTFVDKRSGEVVRSSHIQVIDDLMAKIKQSMRISRLKGLGEMNADELWDTSLNPETRHLIQLTFDESQREVVKDFMGSNPEVRKEVLKKVFADAIQEADTV